MSIVSWIVVAVMAAGILSFLFLVMVAVSRRSLGSTHDPALDMYRMGTQFKSEGVGEKYSYETAVRAASRARETEKARMGMEASRATGKPRHSPRVIGAVSQGRR